MELYRTPAPTKTFLWYWSGRYDYGVPFRVMKLDSNPFVGQPRDTDGSQHRALDVYALVPDSKQFIVIEAKMYSSLGGGTKKVAFYDQAARTVACMATTIERVRKSVERDTRVPA